MPIFKAVAVHRAWDDWLLHAWIATSPPSWLAFTGEGANGQAALC
jgi:hypothetical protein